MYISLGSLQMIAELIAVAILGIILVIKFSPADKRKPPWPPTETRPS